MIADAFENLFAEDEAEQPTTQALPRVVFDKKESPLESAVLTYLEQTCLAASDEVAA